MNCDHFQGLLGAWVDRQLEVAERTALEVHLHQCADCRAALDRARSLHSDLHRAFHMTRAAAAEVADRVVAELRTQIKPPKTTARLPNWTPLVLATALGFVIALLVLHPWRAKRLLPIVDDSAKIIRGKINGEPVGAAPAMVRQTPAARFVVAAGNGEVEYCESPRGPWQPVAELAQFRCMPEGAVRTTASRRCELATSDGSVVRLNGGTEVVFHSARRVEVKRGEIWCRSPADVPLEVLRPVSAKPAFSCMSCDTACFITTVRPGQQVLVTSAAGEVSVNAGRESLQLKASESATITNDGVNRSRSHDSLLAASWIQPLLVSKGYADRELWDRVDDLLARVGEFKMSSLYEDEIRSLGEYGVLPLLRYVQSTRSMSEGERRLSAMRIISDLAPVWAIGDLIELLKDANVEVRFLSAGALERLTGQIQGFPPKQWRANSAGQGTALAAWQTWWNMNRERYPARVSSPPTSIPLPPRTKARRPVQTTSPTG